MASSVVTKNCRKRRKLLLESPSRRNVFTPADLTDDQKVDRADGREFVLKEVSRSRKDLENKKPGLDGGKLVKKGGELGLMAEGVPEALWRRGLDKIATTVLTEKLSIYGGFAVTHGAHAGIGTLHRLFRHRGAKEKISSELATGELIGAYC